MTLIYATREQMKIGACKNEYTQVSFAAGIRPRSEAFYFFPCLYTTTFVFAILDWNK